MKEQKIIWNNVHSNYSNQEWINKPTIFSQTVAKFIPKSGKLLELGAGQGQDTRFFAKNNYNVIASDFSDEALLKNKEKALKENLKNIELKVIDLNTDFEIEEESYDIIYSHLALHYFTKEQTHKIFTKLHQALKKNGILAIILNSKHDEEFSSDNKKLIEEDFFEFNNGMKKRFFSVGSLSEFIHKFNIVLLDDSGESHKNDKNLVRFIGRK